MNAGLAWGLEFLSYRSLSLSLSLSSCSFFPLCLTRCYCCRAMWSLTRTDVRQPCRKPTCNFFFWFRAKEVKSSYEDPAKMTLARKPLTIISLHCGCLAGWCWLSISPSNTNRTGNLSKKSKTDIPFKGITLAHFDLPLCNDLSKPKYSCLHCHFVIWIIPSGEQYLSPRCHIYQVVPFCCSVGHCTSCRATSSPIATTRNKARQEVSSHERVRGDPERFVCSVHFSMWGMRALHMKVQCTHMQTRMHDMLLDSGMETRTWLWLG